MRTVSLVLGFASLFYLGLAHGSSIPPEQREAARSTIDEAASLTIETLLDKQPHIAQAMEAAVGWLVVRFSGAQVVVLGGGVGSGVLVNAQDESRTYMKVRKLEVGPGLGAGAYSVLVVIYDSETFESFRRGTRQSTMGGSAGIQESGTVGSVAQSNRDGYTAFYLSETGAVVSATARLVQIVVNHDLTDTGISATSIPISGFRETGRQTENAPRQWDHKLPILAQRAVDLGYDLPLPYGAGMTYADVEQEQLLTTLEVGVNGGEIVPYEFVSFENAFSNSRSGTVRFDAWLFPFLNVYALLGKVDGSAPLDVLLDGNGTLDWLGTDCSRPPTPPLCGLLEDQTIVLPVDANFEGTTYGVGMTLAAGWRSFFVTVPFNWTYADMDGTQTKGVNITVTPRLGKVFSLNRAGSFAAFIGANYLDSDLDISGEIELLGLLEIEYRIEQENKDKWNAVAGFNWNFNRHWSWSAEYNGFTGSRDAFISSVVYRW